jgi:hypothetical protein
MRRVRLPRVGRSRGQPWATMCNRVAVKMAAGRCLASRSHYPGAIGRFGVSLFAAVYWRLIPLEARAGNGACSVGDRRLRFDLRSPFRACCVVAAFSFWFAASMQHASPNTSWEAHPYAGPFILLKQSRSVGDFVISGAVALGVCIPTFVWVRRGSSWAFALAGAATLLSVWLSWFCAIIASC